MKMMKKNILALALPILASAMCFISCDRDEFTETIFPTDGKPYDESKATAEFDKWIYENFTLPFNTVIDYQMYLPASDLNYQLSPADYEKSVVLSQLIKHLFYDLYNGQAGDIFMKKYAPRQFHFIGSAAYSPTTGTRTLGYASGGVMITLFNVNSIRLKKSWTEDDIELLNHEIFHTMHHEFSHILQQTRTTPTSFRTVTPSAYEPLSWSKMDSLTAHSKGFVTNYSSSGVGEDFVEVLSSIITDQDGTWMHRIINGCLDGVHSGEKEKVYALIDSLGIDLNARKYWWPPYGKDHKKNPQDSLLIVFEDYDEDGGVIGYSTQIHERNVADDENDTKYSGNRKEIARYKTFKEFMDGHVKEDNTLETKGISAILQKIDIATNDWYVPTFNLYVYSLRRELMKRQNDINDWLQNDLKSFPLKVE